MASRRGHQGFTSEKRLKLDPTRKIGTVVGIYERHGVSRPLRLKHDALIGIWGRSIAKTLALGTMLSIACAGCTPATEAIRSSPTSATVATPHSEAQTSTSEGIQTSTMANPVPSHTAVTETSSTVNQSTATSETLDLGPVDIRRTFPTQADGPVNVWVHMLNSVGRAADFFDSAAIAQRAIQCDHRELNPDDGLVLVDLQYDNQSATAVEVSTDVASDSTLATTPQAQSWLAAALQEQASGAGGAPAIQWLVIIGDTEVCVNSVGRVASTIRSGALAPQTTIDRTYMLVLRNWFKGTGPTDQPLPAAFAMQISASRLADAGRSDLGSFGNRFMLSTGAPVACAPDRPC
jgi:hypothetical protein